MLLNDKAGVVASASRIFVSETGSDEPGSVAGCPAVPSCEEDAGVCCAPAGEAIRIAVNNRAHRRMVIWTPQLRPQLCPQVNVHGKHDLGQSNPSESGQMRARPLKRRMRSDEKRDGSKRANEE